MPATKKGPYAPDGLIVIDSRWESRWRILHFDAHAAALFGWKSEQEAVGTSFLENWLDPSSSQPLLENHRRFSILQNGTQSCAPSDKIRVTARREGGQTFQAELTLIFGKSPQGDAGACFYLLVRDIEAFDRVQRNQLFLDSLLENIPNMIFVKDAHDLRFVRFNKAGEQLLGRQRSELLGKNDYDFFPKDQADFFTSKDRAVIMAKKLLDIPEEPIETPQGTRILHTKKIPILDETGEAQFLLGISEDITDRKIAEDLLKKSHDELEHKVQERTVSLTQTMNRLKEALGTRDEFLSIASHELKTPLTTLKLQMELIQRFLTLPAFAIPEARNMPGILRATDRQINRFTKLIDELLDVSRMNTRAIQLRPEPIDLARLVQEVIENFRAGIQESGCTVNTHLEPGIVGSWDRLRVEQVVMNLLENALKYAPRSKIEITVNHANGNARFIIRDHGIGIAQEDLKRIFNRFERAAPVRSTSGMGLGLYISREIVRAHGGDIRVKSELGKGSIFTLVLPLQIAKSAA